MDVELPPGGAVLHDPTIQPVDTAFTLRRLFAALVAAVVVLLTGTIGFTLLLEEDLEDALYRSVVTASLTGLDNRPRGTGPELLTIFLVLAGLTIFAYVASILVEVVARGVVTGAWAERRRVRAIEELSDHYIICGYGRVGRQVGKEFADAGIPFVVVDVNEESIEAAREAGVPFVEGNATDDADLAATGLARARGLVASSDSDTINLYITLSARAAKPELLIVARASDADAAKKLRLAGADRVVQPYATAGKEMAKLVLRPQVAAFLDIVSGAGGPDLQFEEIEVRRASGQAGKTIKELDVRDRTGALIIALRKPDGTFDITPAPDTVIDDGTVIIGVGTASELSALEELFAPGQVVAG